MDFDPFLASQDPCDRYEVGAATRQGPSYLVDIHGAGGCEKHDKPDVVAELVLRSGTWMFVNFHYPPDSGDLLTVLRLLREDRQKGKL